MKYLLLISCVIIFFLLSGNAISVDYQPLSEIVFKSVEEEYGEKAVKRLRYLDKLIIDNQDKSDMEKVILVNKTLNHLPWIADSQHWKQADYWATPMETITTFGGDCEDIAVVKGIVLRRLGISADHLALAYVKIKKTGEDHMVLLYMKNPSAPPGQRESYVLDNYVQEVKKGSERTDLLVILAEAKGELYLITDDGKNRSIKGVYEERKTKKLENLMKRMEEDRKKYQDLNDGRPVLPPL